MKPSMRTYSAKPADFPDSAKRWLIVDADGKTLGRIATHIANALRGKDKPTFTPHVDTGAFVVVVNAEKVRMTGAKLDQKIYYRHSTKVGQLKSTTAREMLVKKPDEVIYQAVKGMLPGNRLSRALLKKLKIFAGSGPEHGFKSQNPVAMEF